MAPGRTITCEELLARSDWVRGLVRRIVLDEDGVDDVLQELHLELWRRRPRLSGDPRSWLAAVSRNLARRARRDESVRREHEARAAVERPRAPADDGVARLRLQRSLADAVLALREPYREAVIERHLDGLEYAALAARHGISEEAARKRVSRGLELLRARLSAELDEDGRATCLALLGLRLEPGAAIETAALGGIVMGAKVWV